MTTAICIEKIKNNRNVTEAYILQDIQYNSKIKLTSSDLKQAIKNGQINVLNLKLTKDSKLIYRKDRKDNRISYVNRKTIQLLSKKKALSFKSYANISSIKSKAKLIGSSFTKLADNLYLVENENSIIIVSDIQLRFTWDARNTFEKTLFTSIDLKEIDTSEVSTMASMFKECKAEHIDLSNFNTSKVTDMSDMFCRCRVKKLDLRSFNTNRVNDMCRMFNECSVEDLNISSFDTSRVENMISMFEKISANKLDLSNFNTSNVTTMNRMFSDCKFNELDLGSFDTSKVDEMSDMFRYSVINKLNVSSFNTSNVRTMQLMFESFKTDYLNLDNFDTINVKDMSGMFEKCRIKELSIKNFDTSNVEYIRYMFEESRIEKPLDLTSFKLNPSVYAYRMFLHCKAEIIATDNIVLDYFRKRDKE